MKDHIRLVLASASPARLQTLRAAGLRPDVVVSGVDESTVVQDSTAALVARLAELKAEAVADRLGEVSRTTVVIGCDSMLDLDGRAYGKPADRAAAVARWQLMSGRSGVLHTGHCLIRLDRGGRTQLSEVASTTVHFAEVTPAEIDAYVGTGEPLSVAGAFTVDGLGGPFVSGVEGDHHNVVGISLPLLRTMTADLGIGWPQLWH